MSQKVEEARTTKEALVWISQDGYKPTKAELIKLLKNRRLQEEEKEKVELNRAQNTLARTFESEQGGSIIVDEENVTAVRARSPLLTEAQEAFINRSPIDNAQDTSAVTDSNRLSSSTTLEIYAETSTTVDSRSLRDAVTQTDKIDGSKPSILKRKTGGRVTGAKHNEQTSNRTSMSMNLDTRTTKIKSRPRSSGWNSSPRIQRPGYERSIRTDEPFFDISSLRRPTSASSSITLNETNTSPTLACELKNTTGINAPAENNKSSTNNIDKPRAFEKTTLVTSRRNDGLISRLKNASVTNTFSGTSLSRRKSETSIPGFISSTNNDHIKSTRSLSASRVESKQQAFGLASDSPVLIKNRQERDRLQRLNHHSVTAMSSSSSSQP